MSSIGIFDSGVGGFGIMREIRKKLPKENLIYFADQKHFPYGEKSYPEIQKITEGIVKFLLEKGSKLIVVACNTASVGALHYLRTKFKDVPIIGVVPVVKTISWASLNKRIGILGTKATINSGYLKGLIEEFCPESLGYKIYFQEAGELVDKAENGEVEHSEKIVKKYLDNFKKHKVDAIALGSTHLPFFKDKIQTFMGPSVTISDSNGAVARQVERVLVSNKQLERAEKMGETVFFTTENPERLKKQLRGLLKLQEAKVEKVDL